MPDTLSKQEIQALDAYWRAANYLSVAQIYLLDNPLLNEPLRAEHIKPRLLGHWGTTPGLNFIYVHLNRIIVKHDLNMIYIAGPGHGGPGLVANVYLEGTYSEVYPNITQDEEGMRKLFKQFSFPGGIPSHVAPETPGSIHEGGELGYALSHGFGAAFDNPDLIVASVIGDGEAETGPLAAAWHSNKFLNPARDGAVLPILHSTVTRSTIRQSSRASAVPSSKVFLSDTAIVPTSSRAPSPKRCSSRWPRPWMPSSRKSKRSRRRGAARARAGRILVLRTPKGWTGPREVDGKKVEGTWRSHQVPLPVMKSAEHIQALERWLKSYRPEELFDSGGRLLAELAALAPTGTRRMGANPIANGGLLLRDLRLPDFRDYALEIAAPGALFAESTRVLGRFVRDVMKLNLPARNFRVFGPDETNFNRLGDLFQATGKTWVAETAAEDEDLAPDGRVMEILSEHTCQGWLEGYLLTGRHGLFSSYEAFIHIIDSMFNQHAKWLKTTSKEIPWRAPIASLNYLLSSHVWRQDHNGFSHQDPGFIDHAVNKKADIIRVYLPPDANTLLSVADHCLRSRNYINIIVAGKQPALQYLDMDAAVKHCTAGIGIWEWASNDKGSEPDVVLACAGDIPTLESLAAAHWLRQSFPELKVRFINVVDLMKLQPAEEHPHGLGDKDFDALFTTDKPVIFAYHGYPWLIHRLTYRRTNHENLHVRGYKEEGTTTTPFDMVVRNDMDRFHLIADAVERVPKLRHAAAYTKQAMRDKLVDHEEYITRYGDDLPEIREWTWTGS